MKNQVFGAFPQKEIDSLSDGNASAREMFMKIATGSPGEMVVGSMLLNFLRNKPMTGDLIGKFWTASENNLMIMTKLLQHIPFHVVMIMQVTTLPVELEKEADKMLLKSIEIIKKIGREEGWYDSQK